MERKQPNENNQGFSRTENKRVNSPYVRWLLFNTEAIANRWSRPAAAARYGIKVGSVHDFIVLETMSQYDMTLLACLSRAAGQHI